MVQVPKHSFVRQVAVPANNPIFSDPYQAPGFPLVFDPEACQIPFSTKKGSQYCEQIHVNTCPELHPSKLAGLRLMKLQNATMRGFIAEALKETTDEVATFQTPVRVDGSVSFGIPADVSSSRRALIFSKLPQLSEGFAYDMNSSCSINNLASTFDCKYEVDIVDSDLPVFSDSFRPPYRFRDGLLQTLFGSIVASWFELEDAKDVAAEADAMAKVPFFTVSVTVPSRFVTDLGSPFPEAEFSQALADELGVGVSADQFFDYEVCCTTDYDIDSDSCADCAWRRRLGPPHCPRAFGCHH
jgi:hypothetical protein